MEKNTENKKTYRRGIIHGAIGTLIGVGLTIGGGILYIHHMWSSDPNRYSEGYAEFPEKRVYDKDLAEFVLKHTKFLDRFDLHKTVDSASTAFCMMEGSIEMPKEDDWKF